MEPLLANTPASDHIIKALCNTLLHSLWQGILLALIAGAIIMFTKKASAAYRYNLLTGAMALFAGCVLFTFVLQLRQVQNKLATTFSSIDAVAPVNIIATVPPANIQAVAPVVHPEVRAGITDTVIGYFNTHYSIIVLIWFLIICIKSIQMSVGLHGVFHLKRAKVFAVSKDWEERLLYLAEQLRIRQTICLLESGIAKVPMVIGHLKPVILIPVGLINSLSTEEVEAILVHELAHIRRRDYLVNLLQSFIEIVFFFNPAVLWISQLIKTERENCCDDLALQQSSDKAGYIQALVSCEEYRSLIPAHAMAFPGSKNSLLDRVKRIVGNRNHSLNMFEKTVLAICLVVLGLGVTAFTAGEHIKKAMKSVAAVVQHDIKGQHINKVKGVNSDTTINKQAALVNSTAALLNQFRSPALSPIDTGKQGALSALITHKIDSLHSNERTANSPLAVLAKMDTAAFIKFHRIGMELYWERLVTDTDHLSISMNDRELIVNGVRMPQQVFERIYRQFGKKGENGSYSSSYSNTDADGNRGNYSTDGDSYHKSEAYYEARAKEQQRVQAETNKKLVADLLRDGLITDPNNVSFALTDKTLTINGKQQSDEIYKKYRDKFVPNNTGTNWSWTYSYHNP